MKLNLAIILTTAIAIAIAYGTLTPPGSGASSLHSIDKPLHFIAFALLVFPLCWTCPKWKVWVVLLAFAFGAAIEVIQPFIGRTGDWADLLADSLGSLTGTLPGLLKQRYRSAQQ